MDESLQHLRLARSEPVAERRPGRPVPRLPRVLADVPSHASVLRDQLRSAADTTYSGASDERRLLKFEIGDIGQLNEIAALPGIEFVAQEGRATVLGFASDDALATFEQRLSTLVSGGVAQRQAVILALDAVHAWSREDRMGRQLRRLESFHDIRCLDVELWPIENFSQSRASQAAFEAWLSQEQIPILDAYQRPELSLYRVEVALSSQIERILTHRDVRVVELPASYGINLREAYPAGSASISILSSPDKDAPRIVVLDTGVEQGHPLLAGAIGDAQSFVGAHSASDDHGHGTQVCGLALYSDLLQTPENGLAQKYWILCGRILDSNAEYQVTRVGQLYDVTLISNIIERAVKYFTDEYGAKIFNLSLGDRDHPYCGGRLDGLAVTLDLLARKFDILFVVSIGNYLEYFPNASADFPRDLLRAEAALIDPATALNAVTVGSLARYDMSHNSQRFPADPREQPVARHREPSPFTRSGPTVNGAVKPDFVDFGGNWAFSVYNGQTRIERGLGEITTTLSARNQSGVTMSASTSSATPHLTHKAASILVALPEAGGSLIRAILGVHARQPEELREFHLSEDERLRLCGYGIVDSDSLAYSSSNDVTLYSAEEIGDQTHHFFEIPIPEQFSSEVSRLRELAISLSHFPPIRNTRMAYKASRLTFRLVSSSLDDAVRSYSRATTAEDVESMPDVVSGRTYSTRVRDRGSLQVSRWRFIRPRTGRWRRLTLVVSRFDAPWSVGMCQDLEKYNVAVRMTDKFSAVPYLHQEIAIALRQKVRVRT